MIKLKEKYGLIFCSLNFEIDGTKIKLENVLIDTGAAKTIINSDFIEIDGTEEITHAFGVGGRETILDKKVSTLKIDNLILNNLVINAGEMDYGIKIDCILGLDILKALNANISIKDMILTFNL